MGLERREGRRRVRVFCRVVQGCFAVFSVGLFPLSPEVLLLFSGGLSPCFPEVFRLFSSIVSLVLQQCFTVFSSGISPCSPTVFHCVLQGCFAVFSRAVSPCSPAVFHRVLQRGAEAGGISIIILLSDRCSLFFFFKVTVTSPNNVEKPAHVCWLVSMRPAKGVGNLESMLWTEELTDRYMFLCSYTL